VHVDATAIHYGDVVYLEMSALHFVGERVQCVLFSLVGHSNSEKTCCRFGITFWYILFIIVKFMNNFSDLACGHMALNVGTCLVQLHIHILVFDFL
jgi:hypothetical protein